MDIETACSKLTPLFFSKFGLHVTLLVHNDQTICPTSCLKNDFQNFSMGDSICNPLFAKYIPFLYRIHSCNGLYLAKSESHSLVIAGVKIVKDSSVRCSFLKKDTWPFRLSLFEFLSVNFASNFCGLLVRLDERKRKSKKLASYAKSAKVR